MTVFVPSLEEISVHLAEVSPTFRAFVEGGQAALDDAEAPAAVPSAEAVAAAQAVVDAGAAATPTPDAAEAQA
jgi:uncharacterized damage-inducible protein DinB